MQTPIHPAEEHSSVVSDVNINCHLSAPLKPHLIESSRMSHTPKCIIPVSGILAFFFLCWVPHWHGSGKPIVRVGDWPHNGYAFVVFLQISLKGVLSLFFIFFVFTCFTVNRPSDSDFRWKARPRSALQKLFLEFSSSLKGGSRARFCFLLFHGKMIWRQKTTPPTFPSLHQAPNGKKLKILVTQPWPSKHSRKNSAYFSQKLDLLFSLLE